MSVNLQLNGFPEVIFHLTGNIPPVSLRSADASAFITACDCLRCVRKIPRIYIFQHTRLKCSIFPVNLARYVYSSCKVAISAKIPIFGPSCFPLLFRRGLSNQIAENDISVRTLQDLRHSKASQKACQIHGREFAQGLRPARDGSGPLTARTQRADRQDI
jgi:hypothetical protein